MLASLVLGAAVLAPAAPVPRDTVPPPTGPAPKLAVLHADPAGQVWVTGVTVSVRKATYTANVVRNGQIEQEERTRDVTQTTSVRKPLADLAGGIATAGGTRLTPDEAARRVKDGAAVLVAADGKPVDPAWLRAVDPETVVFTAPSLANVQFGAAPPAAAARARAAGEEPVAGPTTPEPRLLMLAAGPDGRVKLAVHPTPAGGVAGRSGALIQQGVVANGVAVQFQVVEEAAPAPAAPQPAAGAKKPLDEVAFDVYTAGGALVPRADALARLKAGGMVLVAGDNRLPDPAYLKPFNRDLPVLVSPELNPAGAAGRTVTTFRALPAQIQAVPVLPPAPAAPPAAAPPAAAPRARLVPKAAAPAPNPPAAAPQQPR